MGAEAVLARRRAQRQALLEKARRFVEGLDPDLGVQAAAVFGSVARGDFNRWSDVDVLVVGGGVAGDALDRAEALGPRPGGVRPVAWTPEEWSAARDAGNPLAAEAVGDGVWVLGGPDSIRP